MKKINDKDFISYIQSGHINLLIGAGCSSNFLGTLGDIEEKMNDNNSYIALKAKKEYYDLIVKSKAILDKNTKISEETKLKKTKDNYDNFLRLWAKIILVRSSNIINKQINIFTTNFDMFIEDSCERLDIAYNDGFRGQIKPTFNIANFNKIQKYKSLQFDNTSDIPIFNIIKLHGSISWKAEEEVILYSNGDHIEHIEDCDNFEEYYNKLAIINPNKDKHFKTVLDANYASMLRKFALELEKENSVLILIGFSLADKHIKDLLYSVMKSNPTLIIFYFSYEKYCINDDKHNEKQNHNLYIISPNNEIEIPQNTTEKNQKSTEKDKFSFEDVSECFSKIFFKEE